MTKVVWARFRAGSSIKFFRKLLRGVTSDSLLEKRQGLKNQAARSKRLGKLWGEFDETLVVSEGVKQLHNTYDAEYFFNTHSLARGITESRLLAAVPGFLTAIGVIGTFAGLLLGLANINLEDPEDISSGIIQLIGGASIAFKTSVWGVSLSVAFNVFEKFVEQGVRNRIAKLQDQINALFPRLSPEQTLVYVHEETRKAAITLEGLSERIGARMQEAVTQVAQHVETSIIEGLQQVLKPALDSLVRTTNDLADRQARGGAEALENLIQQFSVGIQGQGDRQRTMMEEATATVTRVVGQWGDSMTDFLAQLEDQNKHQDDREKARAEATDQHLQASQTVVGQGQKLHAQIESVTHDLQTSATELRAGSEFLSNASSGLRTLAERLQAGITQLDNTLGRVLEQTRVLSEENATTGRNINGVLNVMTDLKSTFTSSAATIVEASTAAQEQTAQLAQHQQQFFRALKEHVEQMQQQVAHLLTDYTNQVQAQTQERLNEWNKQTLQFAKAMESAVNSIETVVEEIEDKLGR